MNEMIKIALYTRPFQVSIVPEKRQEITTEGGLNILAQEEHLFKVGYKMKEKDILFSLFIDPEEDQVEAAKRIGANSIELNTGPYSETTDNKEVEKHLINLRKAARQAGDIGLRVFAGHGLTNENVKAIVAIPEVEELNIGHHIVARSVYVGMEKSVNEMVSAVQKGLSLRT